MRIAISAQAPGMQAKASPIFGRCPYYVLVDTETLAVESVANPALSAGGGAGVQAAQFIASQKVTAILSGNVGPNAKEVLDAANIALYLVDEMPVENAVAALRDGKLSQAGSPTVAQHSPMKGQVVFATQARAQELETLKNEALDLRQRLAKIMERINEIEKES